MSDSRPSPPTSTQAKPLALFICIGNSCRSPMAEAIARRDSSDVFVCASAGLTPLGVVQTQTIATLASNAYRATGLASKAIRQEEWTAADLVVNMSGYPKQRVFAPSEWHKVEDWPVEDPYGSDPVVYQRIFEEIRARIESLTARLRDQAGEKWF